MRRHWIAAALLVGCWAALLALDGFGWHKPAARPEDILPVVLEMHAVLAALVGAYVYWWTGRVTLSMYASGWFLLADIGVILVQKLIQFPPRQPGGGQESVLEIPTFLILGWTVGALLGLVGAGVGWFGSFAFDHDVPDAEAGISRIRMVGIATALIVVVAVVLYFGIRPAVIAYAGGKGAKGFVFGAAANGLAAAMLVPVFWARKLRPMVVLAASLAMLVGAALLQPAGSIAQYPVIVSLCLACALADFGAGVTALRAIRR